MACFNPETEEYQSVCRVMSGFSDSFYIEVKVVLTYPLKYSGHANYVSTVEDAEPCGLCQLTLKFPKHFV
jgi:DNA ligase-1